MGPRLRAHPEFFVFVFFSFQAFFPTSSSSSTLGMVVLASSRLVSEAPAHTPTCCLLPQLGFHTCGFACEALLARAHGGNDPGCSKAVQLSWDITLREGASRLLYGLREHSLSLSLAFLVYTRKLVIKWADSKMD